MSNAERAGYVSDHASSNSAADDKRLVDAFGVKPDFVVESMDAIPNSAASLEIDTTGAEQAQTTDTTNLHATRNRVRELLDQHYRIYGCEKAHWILDPEARAKQFPELEEALRALD